MTGALPAALREWRAALGEEHVRTEAFDLLAARGAPFAPRARVPALLRPASPADVQACVRIAQRHRIPLYPTSGGKNWGYGSRVPTEDGSVLVELGRMDRIVHVDEELALVDVEPGVTFRQLDEFLRARGSRLFGSVTGGPPGGSLIGHALERGLGSGPYAHRADHVGSMEVVLPTGGVVRTGYGRYGAEIARVAPDGVGPSLAGLFTQSNLGIVTAMTFWLAPRPVHFQAATFRVDDPDRLAGAVDAMHELALQGVPRGGFHLWNVYKLLATRGQYPWRETAGATPLSLALARDLASRQGIGAWNGSAAVYSASRGLGVETRRLLGRSLGGRVDALAFHDPGAWAHRIRRFLGRRGPADDLARTPYFGVPTESLLPSSFWRKRYAPPADLDPDRSGCGLLWFNATVPFRGRDVSGAVACAERTVLEGGFEPMVSLVLVEPRVAYLVGAIVYDRAVAGEDDRAHACHRRTLASLGASGWLPYRLGVSSMDALPDPTDDSAPLLADLKRVLDPHGVLAPGRYEPPRRGTAEVA